jgi:hypothetical protein
MAQSVKINKEVCQTPTIFNIYINEKHPECSVNINGIQIATKK